MVRSAGRYSLPGQDLARLRVLALGSTTLLHVLSAASNWSLPFSFDRFVVKKSPRTRYLSVGMLTVDSRPNSSAPYADRPSFSKAESSAEPIVRHGQYLCDSQFQRGASFSRTGSWLFGSTFRQFLSILHRCVTHRTSLARIRWQVQPEHGGRAPVAPSSCSPRTAKKVGSKLGAGPGTAAVAKTATRWLGRSGPCDKLTAKLAKVSYGR